MRTDPIDIDERNRKIAEALKRQVAIAIVLLTVVFFFIKIVFL